MSRNKRLSLFDRGNTRCPICLVEFTREGVARGKIGTDATLEHAPPKTLGGSVKCLTCVSCNNGAGKKLDQAASMYKREIINREKGVYLVNLDICGSPYTATLHTKGMDHETLENRAKDPLVAKFIDEKEKENIVLLSSSVRRVGDDWDPNKGIQISTKKPPLEHVVVSWIRSAYLMVFSSLGQKGYQYAESKAVEPIRNQIRNPDTINMPKFTLWFFNSLLKDIIKYQSYFWIIQIGSMSMVGLLPKGGPISLWDDMYKISNQVLTVNDLHRLEQGASKHDPMKFGAKKPAILAAL